MNWLQIVVTVPGPSADSGWTWVTWDVFLSFSGCHCDRYLDFDSHLSSNGQIVSTGKAVREEGRGRLLGHWLRLWSSQLRGHGAPCLLVWQTSLFIKPGGAWMWLISSRCTHSVNPLRSVREKSQQSLRRSTVDLSIIICLDLGDRF